MTMASVYDISANPLIKTELSPAERTAQQTVAEAVLKLNGTTFTDDNKAIAEQAIALQVDYQAAAGVNAFIYTQQVRGARQETFRGGGRRMPPIHPLARKLASSLLNSATTEPVR